MIRNRVRAAAALALSASLAAGAAAASILPAANAAGLSSRAYFNDPDADGANTIRYLVKNRFDGAPSGSTARVVMFNIDDDYIMDAMVAAKRRGVNVKVIVAKSRCDNVARLRSAFGTDRSRGSWVYCSPGSTRSEGGNVHQKSITFSRTGDTPYVTLVGSANLTEEGWRDQWTDMFQYANRKDVYTAYNNVFAVQAKGASLPSPYRSWTAADGVARANFFPVNDETPEAADDPVLTRLNNLPSNRNTTIIVANYATHGSRGSWLVNALIAKKRAGATVQFISGPPTDDGLERRMRSAGIPVTRAFDASCATVATHVDGTCNYIHLKGMTAKYWADGTWNYRSYTGSDNWSNAGLNNDEVTQRIGGQSAYDQYVAVFRKIQNRY